MNAELGTFLHRAFEVLGARPDLKTELPRITGVAADAAAIKQLATAVAGFEARVRATMKPTEVRRE